MPPPSTSHQKVLIGQFHTLTGAQERVATRFLKASGFKLNEAVDSYYASNPDSSGPSAIETKLDALFTGLQSAEDSKDKLELNSTMEYLTKLLEVNIENAELFVALEILQAPTLGDITRKGYVSGWKLTGKPEHHEDHAMYIKKLSSELSTDTTLFRKVYRYAFVVGRESDQKSLSLENALIYWGILFSPPGITWESKNHNWLDLWKSFLAEKWTRSVNKDMWNMTLEFALKSMADESLSFWSEDGAWPSVIDDFVEWCKERGIGKNEGMEVDD